MNRERSKHEMAVEMQAHNHGDWSREHRRGIIGGHAGASQSPPACLHRSSVGTAVIPQCLPLAASLIVRVVARRSNESGRKLLWRGGRQATPPAWWLGCAHGPGRLQLDR